MKEAKCHGEYCRIKAACARYTAQSSGKLQHWFMDEPCEVDGFACRFFIWNSRNKIPRKWEIPPELPFNKNRGRRRKAISA